MRSLRCALFLGGLTLAVGITSAKAQQPDKDKAEKIPPVVVTEPTTTPTPAPPTPPAVPWTSPLFDPRANIVDFGPTRSSFDDPRSRTDLNRAQIEEKASGTTPRLLENIPGVLIQRTNAGGGSLIIRGRNGYQNLIMVDGIPINDSGWRIGNVQYLNTIDPGIIDHLEVLRGPESVLYGSGALGGVLNIVTKKRESYSQPFGANGALIADYGTAVNDPYNRLETTGNVGAFGWYAGASSYNPGAFYAGQDVDFPDFATGYDQIAGNARIDYHLNDNWTLTAFYMKLFQNDVPRTDRFPLPQVDPTRNINRPTYADQGRDLGYVRLQMLDDTAAWINGLQITGWVQRRLERERELDFGAGGNSPRFRNPDESFRYGGLDLRAFTNFSESHTLGYGVFYQMDTNDATRFNVNNFPVGIPPGTVQQLNPPTPPDGKYQQIGVYLMDYFAPTDRWLLNAGVRYSQVHAEGTIRSVVSSVALPRIHFNRYFVDWSAEFGATFKVSDQLHWVSSVSEGFRAPNLEDLGSDERTSGQGVVGGDNGNINLDPERVTNFETGFKYRGDRLALDATAYYLNMPSLISRSFVVVPPATVSNNRTNSDGYTWGVEAQFGYVLTDSWSLFGNFSYSFGVDKDLDLPPVGAPVNFPGSDGLFLRTPPVFGVLGARWTHRAPKCGLFFETWAEMMGSFHRTTFFDRTDPRVPLGGTDGWQTWNMRVGLDGDEWGKLTLGLTNIFDQNYRIIGSGIDAPGIEFRVGYILNF